MREDDSPRGWRLLGTAAWLAVRAALALAAGLAVPVVVNDHVGQTLNVRTTIVGYPIFYDFDVERYIHVYELSIVGGPVAAALVYLLLTFLGKRLIPGLQFRPRPTASAPTVEGPQGPPDFLGQAWAVVHSVLAAAVPGLEVAVIHVSHGGTRFTEVAVAVTAALAGGALLVALVAFVWRRWPLLGVLRAVNALYGALALLLLGGVSAVTTVTVASTGRTIHYPWFPWPLAAVLACVTLLILAEVVRRQRSWDVTLHLERWCLLTLSAPVALLLFLVQMPGAVVNLDFFGDGEHQAAAALMNHGYLPWRDILMIHGILMDAVYADIGMFVFGNTHWAMEAGSGVIVIPATVLSIWYGCVYMFHRRRWWLPVCFLLVLGSLMVPIRGDYFRFILWPPILILVGLTMERRSPLWPCCLAVLLVVQAIITPESAYCVVACALVVLAADVSGWQRSRSPLANLRRSGIALAGGVAALAVFCVYLLVTRSTSAFISYYSGLAVGHELDGGVPITRAAQHTLNYVFPAIVPIVAVSLTAIWFFSCWRRRRQPEPEEWVAAAIALMLTPYYTEFLDRADGGHVMLAYGVGVLLYLLIACRIVGWLDGSLGLARWSVRPVAVVVLAVVVWNSGLPGRFDALATSVRAVSPRPPPPVAKVGYYSGNPEVLQIDRDLSKVLAAYLPSGGWVFDFTNQSELYYYLLGGLPRTRYYEISNALTAGAQADVVRELNAHPPDLVVEEAALGEPYWDFIPNQVRDYNLSRYLLQHYRPLLQVDADLIYVRDTLHVPPPAELHLQTTGTIETTGLPFDAFPCTWGYSLHFLDADRPAPTERGVAVPVGPLMRAVTASGWAGEPGPGVPAKEVVMTVAGRVVATTVPDVSRPDVAAATNQPGFADAGFAISYTSRTTINRSQISFYAVGSRGLASWIGGAKGGPPQITLSDGTVARVGPGLAGTVDSISQRPARSLAIPPGLPWSAYRWISFRTSRSIQGQRIIVTDDLASVSSHWISLEESAGQRSYSLPASSCPQWYGYGTSGLYITGNGVVRVTAVHVLK